MLLEAVTEWRRELVPREVQAQEPREDDVEPSTPRKKKERKEREEDSLEEKV